MTSRRVIVSYFTIAGLFTLAAALIWGVNTLFLLDAGILKVVVPSLGQAFSGQLSAADIPFHGIVLWTFPIVEMVLGVLLVVGLHVVSFDACCAADSHRTDKMLTFTILPIVRPHIVSEEREIANNHAS